ncbi:MAG: hypothetical protein AABO58_00850 [Acidobacteriota bacterium]
MIPKLDVPPQKTVELGGDERQSLLPAASPLATLDIDCLLFKIDVHAFQLEHLPAAQSGEQNDRKHRDSAKALEVGRPHPVLGSVKDARALGGRPSLGHARRKSRGLRMLERIDDRVLLSKESKECSVPTPVRVERCIAWRRRLHTVPREPGQGIDDRRGQRIVFADTSHEERAEVVVRHAVRRDRVPALVLAVPQNVREQCELAIEDCEGPARRSA